MDGQGCDIRRGCSIKRISLAYEKGVKLPAKTDGDIITYYAGAKFAENSRALLSNGGRVYMLVTTVDTVKEAQNPIYQELNKQNTEGLFYRTDIGARPLDKRYKNNATKSPNPIMVV